MSDDLTPRQREAVALLHDGYTNAGIARALGITEKMVKRHLTASYKALALDGNPRIQAAMWHARQTALATPIRFPREEI